MVFLCVYEFFSNIPVPKQGQVDTQIFNKHNASHRNYSLDIFGVTGLTISNGGGKEIQRVHTLANVRVFLTISRL